MVTTPPCCELKQKPPGICVIREARAPVQPLADSSAELCAESRATLALHDDEMTETAHERPILGERKFTGIVLIERPRVGGGTIREIASD